VLNLIGHYANDEVDDIWTKFEQQNLYDEDVVLDEIDPIYHKLSSKIENLNDLEYYYVPNTKLRIEGDNIILEEIEILMANISWNVDGEIWD